MSSRGLPGPIHVAVEDDRDKLKKANDRLTRENEDLKLENQKLKMQERRTLGAVANLKNWTDPLFQSLKLLNGEFDSMDLPEAGGGNITPGHNPSVSNSRVNPKFEAALLRLDGKKQEILKLIIDMGPMSMAGIKAVVGGRQQTLYDATSYLGRLGLIKNVDKKFRLNED